MFLPSIYFFRVIVSLVVLNLIYPIFMFFLPDYIFSLGHTFVVCLSLQPSFIFLVFHAYGRLSGSP